MAWELKRKGAQNAAWKRSSFVPRSTMCFT